MDKDVSLIDIANLCGFEDQSYFTRVFKKMVGVSPKKYRDSRGAVALDSRGAAASDNPGTAMPE